MRGRRYRGKHMLHPWPKTNLAKVRLTLLRIFLNLSNHGGLYV